MRIALPARRPARLPLVSLVDVVFILLFFFMLASSYLDWRSVQVELGGAAPQAPEAQVAWSVQVYADGSLTLNGALMSRAAIEAALRAEPGVRVVLQPVPGVRLQALVAVFDALRPTGAALILGRLPE